MDELILRLERMSFGNSLPGTTVYDINRLAMEMRAEVKRLQEFEWMYKDLCK